MRKNLPRITTGIRVLATLVFLGYAFFNTHWSIFGILVLMTVSIEGLAATLAMQGRLIRAMRQIALEDKDNFTEFINTINSQAVALKKEMNICRECEKYAQHGIRPGSIHNKTADNCLLKDSKVFS